MQSSIVQMFKEPLPSYKNTTNSKTSQTDSSLLQNWGIPVKTIESFKMGRTTENAFFQGSAILNTMSTLCIG